MNIESDYDSLEMQAKYIKNTFPMEEHEFNTLLASIKEKLEKYK